MEQKHEKVVVEEEREKKPFVILADDCTIVFDDLPEAVKNKLDDTPAIPQDWKCCNHCGAHEEGVKFITCPQCLECPLGPTYYCNIGCQIDEWPFHKVYCTDRNRDERKWERVKFLRDWDSVARPIIVWAMKQVFYFNPDYDPRKSFLRIFVQGDVATDGPSRLWPEGVFLVPRDESCVEWSDDSSERWWYCLDFHHGPPGDENFQHLLFHTIVNSDWKRNLVLTDGAFEDWSYIFFHTCPKRSFTKFSLYTRANLLISAGRIARDMEPQIFMPPMTDNNWQKSTTMIGQNIKTLPFGRRKVWMMMIQAMRVWDIMVETGSMKQVMATSCDPIDSKPCFPIVPDHRRLKKGSKGPDKSAA